MFSVNFARFCPFIKNFTVVVVVGVLSALTLDGDDMAG
jgi:hypothetical protein